MQSPKPVEAKSRPWTGRHPVAVGLSLLAHGAVVAALLVVVVPARPLVEAPPVTVALTPSPIPAPAAPGEPAPSTPNKALAAAPPSESLARRAPIPPPAEIRALGAGASDAPAAASEISATELAAAVTAEGSGAGGGGGTGSGQGGGCNMVRRLQTALRKDQLVLAAARSPETAGKALRVWDGDWVQSSGEAGKDLAAVREAIMWEVAFAPAACRAEPVHGLVLISLNDGAGSTRLALGGGEWRWSDLLGLRAEPR